jgi:RNA polymerase sigma factor (sigma-70 family)
LPEADQQILHLRHISEMSFKQIAEVLQQPLGTVLARHFRALKRLRDKLSEEKDL